MNGVLSMQGTATYANGPFALTYGASAILEYKGSAAQTTGPERLATLPNLRIDNTSGVTLSSATTVNGTAVSHHRGFVKRRQSHAGQWGHHRAATGSLAAVPTFGTSVNLTLHRLHSGDNRERAPGVLQRAQQPDDLQFRRRDPERRP